MRQTQQWQLQRRLRRYERHSRWERLWNRLWAYRVGSPKHFFVAFMDLIIGQDWWVSPVVGSAVLALGGGIARLIGGRFLTGVLAAAAILVLLMVASGWVRFRREVQGIWTWPPGSGGHEEAGVREPRRPPPGGGEMSAALELDHNDSD